MDDAAAVGLAIRGRHEARPRRVALEPAPEGRRRRSPASRGWRARSRWSTTRSRRRPSSARWDSRLALHSATKCKAGRSCSAGRRLRERAHLRHLLGASSRPSTPGSSCAGCARGADGRGHPRARAGPRARGAPEGPPRELSRSRLAPRPRRGQSGQMSGSAGALLPREGAGGGAPRRRKVKVSSATMSLGCVESPCRLPAPRARARPPRPGPPPRSGPSTRTSHSIRRWAEPRECGEDHRGVLKGRWLPAPRASAAATDDSEKRIVRVATLDRHDDSLRCERRPGFLSEGIPDRSARPAHDPRRAASRMGRAKVGDVAMAHLNVPVLAGWPRACTTGPRAGLPRRRQALSRVQPDLGRRVAGRGRRIVVYFPAPDARGRRQRRALRAEGAARGRGRHCRRGRGRAPRPRASRMPDRQGVAPAARAPGRPGGPPRRLQTDRAAAFRNRVDGLLLSEIRPGVSASSIGIFPPAPRRRARDRERPRPLAPGGRSRPREDDRLPSSRGSCADRADRALVVAPPTAHGPVVAHRQVPPDVRPARRKRREDVAEEHRAHFNPSRPTGT